MGKIVLPLFIDKLADGPHKRDMIRHYKKQLRKRKKANGK